MRAIIRKPCTVFLMFFAMLLFNSEAKAQTQESQNLIKKMEPTEANIEILQLGVEGMHCQAGCANGIDSMLKQQEGIIESKTFFDSSSSEIKYDKSKISEKEIIALIEGKGFKIKAKNDDQVE